jgi:hypothetical protein
MYTGFPVSSLSIFWISSFPEIQGPLRYPLEDEDEDPPELARLKVPPLLPTMEFPVLSIVNVMGKFLLGVMYTSCPDVVEPVSNVPLICVHPNSDTAAGLEGVNVHEFPL